MKILTWNINGIRAAIKKGIWEKLEDLNVDIACFQETKADETIMESELVRVDKFNTYFNSCTLKKGYSGVANYVSNEFEDLGSDQEIGVEEFDAEGRYIATKFSYNEYKIVLINCYYPQGGRDFRIPFKLKFYEEVLKKANFYRKQGFLPILCGDFNTTFADIDLARPNENRKTTGCLPEERKVLNDFVDNGYIDVFRELNPQKDGAYTYWDQITRARDRNVGWRIDYYLIDKALLSHVKDVEIMADVLGSDHCPVILTLK